MLMLVADEVAVLVVLALVVLVYGPLSWALPVGMLLGAGLGGLFGLGLTIIVLRARDPATAGMPISGIGGIGNWRDALDFIALGSGTVQVCTAAMVYGFKIVQEMESGRANWMDDKGFQSIADFRGKAKHLEYKAREHQPAMLCTLVMTENTDAKGVKRYPVGSMPVMDPATGEVLIDTLGRRSYTTSVAYGPTIGKNIALAYLPWDYCQVGRTLNVEYFGETYPVEVAGVGYKPLYDAENLKPRS